jgi:hypothetical protein
MSSGTPESQSCTSLQYERNDLSRYGSQLIEIPFSHCVAATTTSADTFFFSTCALATKKSHCKSCHGIIDPDTYVPPL